MRKFCLVKFIRQGVSLMFAFMKVSDAVAG